jgi:hypothetical protein
VEIEWKVEADVYGLLLGYYGKVRFVQQIVLFGHVETNGLIPDQQLKSNPTASTLSFSETCTPRQLSSAISATSSMANGSYRHHGKPASQWAVPSDKSLEPSSHLTLWNGLAARRLSELVLSFLLDLSSYSSSRDRCRCFWLGSYWGDWYGCSL